MVLRGHHCSHRSQWTRSQHGLQRGVHERSKSSYSFLILGACEMEVEIKMSLPVCLSVSVSITTIRASSTAAPQTCASLAKCSRRPWRPLKQLLRSVSVFSPSAFDLLPALLSHLLPVTEKNETCSRFLQAEHFQHSCGPQVELRHAVIPWCCFSGCFCSTYWSVKVNLSWFLNTAL